MVILGPVVREVWQPHQLATPDLYLAAAAEPQATAPRVVAAAVLLGQRATVATAAILRPALLALEVVRQEAAAAAVVLLGILALPPVAAGAVLSAIAAPVMRVALVPPVKSVLPTSLQPLRLSPRGAALRGPRQRASL